MVQYGHVTKLLSQVNAIYFSRNSCKMILAGNISFILVKEKEL